MMNVQSISKVAETNDPKPNPTKPGNDQGKIINQLRQEIKKLNNTIKEMQRKPDIQAINIAIPRKLLSKVNQFLLDYAQNTGELINISDLFCDAIDVYLWAKKETSSWRKSGGRLNRRAGIRRNSPLMATQSRPSKSIPEF